MEQNIFEKATRCKLRIESPKGQLTVEQLWDLPLTSAKGASLDGVGQIVQRELRELREDSLVETKPSPRKAVLSLSLELIKHVIAVRQAENAAARDAALVADERKKLLGALEAKQGEKLSGMSEEDIQARLAELGQVAL